MRLRLLGVSTFGAWVILFVLGWVAVRIRRPAR
jgi:hypothetical protein